MQRRFHPADTGAHHLGYLGQAVLQDVFEKHGGSLLGRKLTDERRERLAEWLAFDVDIGVERVLLFFERHVVLPLAALPPDVIDALVMCDAEQPGLEPVRFFERVEVVEGFGQRLLHDVLTVEHRAAHARAKAVQLGSELSERAQELLARALERRLQGCGGTVHGYLRR